MVVSACNGGLPSTSVSSSPTAGQLEEAGKTVYANSCAKCHGDKGQGVTAPSIIGTAASLDKYNTAQGLLNFISTVMPADAPGTLSQQAYLQVLSYLLVENKYISPETIIDSNLLDKITLKK